MNENKFTPTAEEALRLAQEAAGELGHGYVGTEHLLLGLMREDEGMAHTVLTEAGLTDDLLTEMVRKSVGAGLPGGNPAQGLTPRAKHVVEIAMEDSIRGGYAYIGTEHLLMGLLREGNNMAVRILRSAGVDARQLYTALMKKLTAAPRAAQSGDSRTPAAGSAKEDGKGSKTLAEFTRDLTADARTGKLDPVIGRDDEIQRVIQILSRRTKNNPCLIGEPGVGKTAIAEGLAQRIVAGDVPFKLRDKEVYLLDLTALVAGTQFRGQFEQRMKGLIDEVKKLGNIILMIDEIHNIVGAGDAEGSMNAANILKPALSRGEIQVIGATTFNEYRKYIEKDQALERRFQPVRVEEPSVADTLAVMNGIKKYYEEHHHVQVDADVLSAIVTLSERYITDRYLPDKAIDLLDEACACCNLAHPVISEYLEMQKELDGLRQEEADMESSDVNEAIDYEQVAQRKTRIAKLEAELPAKQAAASEIKVTMDDVAKVIELWTGIPAVKIQETEFVKLAGLEAELKKKIIGQDEAVTKVSEAILRSRAGIANPNRPIGSFLFLGPTGVGKTELAKALAQALFDDERNMVRIDMTEYMEKFSVSRLIGAPPGYVGYEEGGQLTEAVRRKPYSVVLFDEVEKAHPDVFNILLQVLDDGRITDSQGRTVDFKNTVIILTSNLGSDIILNDLEQRRAEGSNELSEDARKQIDLLLKSKFRPEFLNRLDEIVYYKSLTKDETRKIVDLQLEDLRKRMDEGKHLKLDVTTAAKDFIIDSSYDSVYGARPIKRFIQSRVETLIAKAIIQGSYTEGATLTVDYDGTGLVLR